MCQCVTKFSGLFTLWDYSDWKREMWKYSSMLCCCDILQHTKRQQKDASNGRIKYRSCYILWCEFDSKDYVPSHSLSHNKHNLWHSGVKSKVHSDVLACHKSKVKCSIWSPRPSCWNAFVDHTVSCFISQHVSMGLEIAMEGLMRVKIDLPLSDQWPSP